MTFLSSSSRTTADGYHLMFGSQGLIVQGWEKFTWLVRPSGCFADPGIQSEEQSSFYKNTELTNITIKLSSGWLARNWYGWTEENHKENFAQVNNLVVTKPQILNFIFFLEQILPYHGRRGAGGDSPEPNIGFLKKCFHSPERTGWDSHSQ